MGACEEGKEICIRNACKWGLVRKVRKYVLEMPVNGGL